MKFATSLPRVQANANIKFATGLLLGKPTMPILNLAWGCHTHKSNANFKFGKGFHLAKKQRKQTICKSFAWYINV